jgi:hypothetical protein
MAKENTSSALASGSISDISGRPNSMTRKLFIFSLVTMLWTCLLAGCM